MLRAIAIGAVSAVLLAGGALGAERGPLREGTARAERAPVHANAAPSRPAPVQMGVVLNALDNPFWLAIYDGARVEALGRGVPVTFRAVTSNADLPGQAAQARALVAASEDCYAVGPITATDLVTALRGITRPIVVINSPIDPAAAKRAGVHLSTYIGTNDFAAGRLAGARMASLLPGGGEVALLGGWAGNINSVLRLGGFERGIQGSRLRVVAQVNADYDRTTAEIAADRILRTYPHLSGFFAANDLMALGIADSVGAAGKTGKVKIIGLDGIAEALDAIQAGTISATVSQYPYVMGQMAVEACAAAAGGATLPARVDAPIALLTKDNVARAIAAFPLPVQRHSDPFSGLLRSRG
jgi:ABC-type sugar transport system substrate-binding protein